MSESHDISETDTHTMPDFPAHTPDGPLDFGPLFTDDAENEDITQLPIPTRAPRKRWLIWLSVILLLILLGGIVFAIRSFRRAPAVTYTQAAATVGNLTVTATGTGPVQPAAVYNLDFATSAPVASINVQVGQQVHQGDLLATLDPTALQDAINQAQNNVNSAQTAVNTAASNLSNTKTQQATALNIAQLTEQKAISACSSPGSGGSSGSTGSSGTPTPTPTPDPNCIKLAQAQFTQAQNQANAAITQAQNQVNSAQQQLTSAQAALQTAQDNLKNASLLAPANGVIDAINGRVGENAGSNSGNANTGNGNNGNSSGGSSSGSAFIVLVDSSTLNVAAQINEADIANVSVNQPATFTVAAYPSQTFRATVSSIDTLGTTSSNVVTYLVDLAVDMQSLNKANLYPNMTATVNITTAERIGVLLVPSTALSFPTTAIQNGELNRNDLRSLVSTGALGKSAGSGSRGIVLELKNGKLVPVLVTTGLTDGQFTEITSGLNEGDQVVVSQTGGTTTGGNNGGGGFGGGRGGGGGGGGIINGRGN